VQLLITGKKPDPEKIFAHNAFPRHRIVSLLAAMTWAAVQATALRIIVIGIQPLPPTTQQTRSRAGPGTGYFFSKNVTVLNKAIGGRSSRSFIEDGHWTSTLAILQKGDYLLVSFGTNDAGSVAARHTDTAVSGRISPNTSPNRAPRALFPSLCQPSIRTPGPARRSGRLYRLPYRHASGGHGAQCSLH